MSTNTHEHKQALETALITVTEELKRLGVHNPETPSDWIATPPSPSDAEPDSNVEADRVEDWDEHRATLSLLETRYNNITRALAKLEAGTYGTCEVCGEAIETDRLTVHPAARTCKAHLEDESSLT